MVPDYPHDYLDHVYRLKCLTGGLVGTCMGSSASLSTLPGSICSCNQSRSSWSFRTCAFDDTFRSHIHPCPTLRQRCQQDIQHENLQSDAQLEMMNGRSRYHQKPFKPQLAAHLAHVINKAVLRAANGTASTAHAKVHKSQQIVSCNAMRNDLTLSSSDSVYASLRALDAAADALFFSFLVMFFHALELKSIPSAQKMTSVLLLRDDLPPDPVEEAATAPADVSNPVAMSWQEALCGMPRAAKAAGKASSAGVGALAAPCKANSRLEAGLNSIAAEACFLGGTGGSEKEFFLLLRSRLNFRPGCGGSPC